MPSHLKRKRASVEDQRQHEDHDDTTSEQVMMALSLCVINNETEEAPSKLQKEYKLQFSSLEKSKWLQITCYPSHFFTKFEEIRPSLSNNVLNILYSSPFGHFFLRNKDISMEKSLVQDIVSTYSTSRSVFVVGDLEINLGSEEACLLLGLPLVGNSVNLAKRGTASGLRRRYSMLHGRVTRQRLFSCIKEAISHKDDENAARLLIMFLFATILFPAPNSSVPTALFEYVDDLYSLWSFKWGDEVLKYLLGGVRHVVGSRKAGKSMGQLHGCSLLLLAMLYYRSENPRVFCGRGLIPRLLNLDFKRTWKSLEKLSPFKEITIKAQTYEKWIISGSSRPTEWMDMLLSTMSRKQRKEMNVNFSKSSSVRHELEEEVPVEEVHRSNELEHNHAQLELRIAAYEVELMELKKQQDLNQRTLVEKINNLVDIDQQRKDEMVEIQRNQLSLVDKLNAFEQQHKDEMVEVQRNQLALVSKFDTFEKDNASLRSNVDLLFEKVMQKLEKLDKMEEFITEKFETKEGRKKSTRTKSKNVV